jgi:hypothetical protein
MKWQARGTAIPRPGQPITNPLPRESASTKEAIMAEEFTDAEIVCEMGRMGGLAAELTLMFARAATLPEPTSASIYGVIDGYIHDSVTLQFPRQMDSAETLAMWATMFGGVIESSTKDTEDGRQLWVKTSFPWMHL